MPLGAFRERLAQRRAELRARGVAVLAGGGSHEREVSLTSGRAVAQALRGAGYAAELLAVKADDLSFDPAELQDAERGALPVAQVNQAGATRSELAPGVPGNLIPLVRQAGMILTTLHGTRGEDGVWQGLLELMDVPYVSAGVKGSALAMDKLTAKRLFQQLGVPTPPYWVERRGKSCRGEVPAAVSQLVAKPVNQGSSVGIEMVDNDEAGWATIAELLTRFEPLLIEERIPGRELTAGVIGPCADALALPLLEIKPRRGFYDYTAKYTAGESEYVCPATVDQPLVELVQGHALTIYRELELEPYARIDLLLDAAGRPWFLEANTLPGFTPLSLLPKAAQAAGIEFDELLELLMLWALERWEKRHGGDR